jgi:hypothetical protein
LWDATFVLASLNFCSASFKSLLSSENSSFARFMASSAM